MQEKKPKKKKRKQIPVRLNTLFFFVFLLFSILVLRLGFIQIVHGEDFRKEMTRTESITISQPVPRGRIFDRHYRLLVDNAPQHAITFINQGHSMKDTFETARRLANLIGVDTSKVTERDRKEFWVQKYRELAEAKVPEMERDELKTKLKSDELISRFNQLIIERITDADLAMLSAEDLEACAVLKEFRNSTEFSPQIVKNKGVSDKEFAEVSESLQSLPGVETTTDWERIYPHGETFRPVLGKVTDSKEGIPSDQLDFYSVREYNRNDRVGKSYLEWQYEDVLAGKKSRVKKLMDKDGNVLDVQTVAAGEQGKDLVLTVDLDLQKEVEKIIEDVLIKTKQQKETQFLDRAFVVLLDPFTGEVLTMAGRQLVKKEDEKNWQFEDLSLGNVTTSYNVGSTVKGATVLTGFKHGVIHPKTVIVDEPLKIKGTPVKKSWHNFGAIDDVYALRRSSNVYMFKTVIAIGKGHYGYDKPLNLAPNTFQIVRDSFAQFGLGTRTGIDLPNETIGYKGVSQKPGFLLDLAIGQYDTYSPMQLAQYVATIANGGYRIQPRIVREIRQPFAGEGTVSRMYNENQPKIMNHIDVTEAEFKRVQEGFRQVMQHPLGTAYKEFHTAPYSPAGKTGTAEAFYDGPNRYQYKEPPPVMNLSLVAFAPSDKPKVAMAVMVPWVYTGEKGPSPNLEIGRRVMDLYFQKY